MKSNGRTKKGGAEGSPPFTVSDAIMERLAACGVRRIYGSWEQRVMEGEPKFEASQELPDVPYARYAELLGLRGIRVEKPEDVGAVWDEAFAADRPVVIDVKVNADIPTVPPRPKQAKQLEQALDQDPAAPAIREQMRRQGIGAEG